MKNSIPQIAALIAFVVIITIIIIVTPKQQPKPPVPLIKLPTAQDVGHKIGKVTGDGTKGFLKGIKESWLPPKHKDKINANDR